MAITEALKLAKKIRWERFVARGGHPVLLMDTIRASNAKYLKKVLGIPNLTYWKRYAEASFFASHELKAIKNVLYRRLVTYPEAIFSNLKVVKAIISEAVSWAKRLENQRWSNASKKRIDTTTRQFFSQTYRFWTTAYFPMMMDSPIRKYLKSVARVKEVDAILSKYARPRRLNALQRKANHYYQLKKRYGSKLPLSLIQKLRKKYFWTKSYVFHVRPYTIRDVVKEVKTAKPVYLPPVLKLPNELKPCARVLDTARKLVELRDYRILEYSRFIGYLQPFLKELAKTLGLSYEELIQLTTEEILKRKFNKQDIKKRAKGVGYLVVEGHGFILVGRQVKELATEKGWSEVKILHGRTGFPGLVKGRVKKVNPYIYEKIRKGDIIVTGMTTPEIVPFLKKVRAIVTDEGGVTAHAAIISREFKIPCVLGTKIATQALNDGDLVEVDATKGIVRKLK